MGITLADIKRALLNGGDVAALTTVLHDALGEPPVPCSASLEIAAVLPDAAVLLSRIDKGLAALMNRWQNGKSSPYSAAPDVTLQFVETDFDSPEAGDFAAMTIGESQPDVIALDVSPFLWSMTVLYALSIPAAVGLPCYSEAWAKEGLYLHARKMLLPRGSSETLALWGWLNRIPVLPVGMPVNPTFIPVRVGDRPYLEQVTDSLAVSDDEKLKALYAQQYSVTGDLVMPEPGQPAAAKCGLSEEEKYTASRLAEIAALPGNSGHKKILVFLSAEQHDGVQAALNIMLNNPRRKMYLPPIASVAANKMVMVSKHVDTAEQGTKQLTAAQELLDCALEKLANARSNAYLSEEEVEKIIPLIVGRTRRHPDIARGASVRGAIALKEVFSGLETVQPQQTYRNLEKAALITLVPRISVKLEANKSATTLVEDIVKETLFHIKFFRNNVALKATEKIKSAEDRKLESDYAELMKNNKIAPGATVEIVDHIEEDNSEGLHLRGRSLPYTRIQVERTMSRKSLAQTMMEFMDSQDKQGRKKLNLQQIYDYYRLNADANKEELDPLKKDRDGLKILLEDLQKRGIITMSADSEDFTFTGISLGLLLDYLIARSLKPKKRPEFLARVPTSERGQETRRYSSGNVSRDIAARRTLREVARQKKSLTEVSRRDLRVFIKQRRKIKTDIVLCIDSSASMGFRHKLMYSRLAAAGLAKLAVTNGDRIGIIAFDDFGNTTLPLTEGNAASIINYIASISAGGNTNIGEGIRCAHEMLVNQPSQNWKHILVITDGEPTAISKKAYDQLRVTEEKGAGEAQAILETRRAAAHGVRVSIVHVVSDRNGGGQFVRNVSRAGKGRVQKVVNIEDIKTMLQYGVNGGRF